MIEQLRKNVNTEIDILREILVLSQRLESTEAGNDEKRIIAKTIDSLRSNIKTINHSTPGILNSISVEGKALKKAPSLEKITRGMAEGVTLRKEDKEKFLSELNISESLIKKLKKRGVEKKEEYKEFKKARGYLKLSNKIFLNRASILVKKGYFDALREKIKKANLDILFEAYVAMMLLSVALSLGVAVIAMITLLFFVSNAGFLLLPLAIPFIVFAGFYFYPSSEAKSIAKNVNMELPFAVVHMSAISGSGIEPTEIFKIIGLSREYPYLRKEIRKVLNQINIYGYDLVTALNNVSKSTSSPKLSELLAGLSTTISTGGSLGEFFEKRAETLLVGYKLDNEKAIKIAETFMDIYISVVIAAPMILMLLLIMISISGLQTGFSPYQLSFITIIGVAIVNVIFLVFLQTQKGGF